jgi:tRNA nucleotidyltransferase (CCA-adding enzyme)
MPTVDLARALDAHQLALLHALGQAADAAGAKLYAVGGIVRDAVLGIPVADIDLASETPAGDLAPKLVAALGGQASAPTPFATAKLTIDGQAFDLATARTETYATPGTLPVVAASTIAQDLGRRDFTINAMAISLAPGDFGALLDPHGGRADLDARKIRALHPASFADDPTRAFRAVRYATRLGFRIDRRSTRWMRADASLIQQLSGTRIRHEIEHILGEPRAAAALAAAQRRGLLSHVHPAFDSSASARALRAATRSKLVGLELLAALMYPLSTDVPALARRLSLSAPQARIARFAVLVREAEAQLAKAPPSAVERITAGAPKEVLASIARISPNPGVRAALRLHARRTNNVVHHLDGHDLARLGVPNGPPTGQALEALRGAELDNTVRTRQSAERFIKKNASDTGAPR